MCEGSAPHTLLLGGRLKKQAAEILHCQNFITKNPISNGCEFMWLALAFYSTAQALTYTGKARKIKMYAGKNIIV